MLSLYDTLRGPCLALLCASSEPQGDCLYPTESLWSHITQIDPHAPKLLVVDPCQPCRALGATRISWVYP